MHRKEHFKHGEMNALIQRVEELGEEYIELRREEQQIQKRKDEIHAELRELLRALNTDRVDSIGFTVSVKRRSKTIGWKWSELIKTFGRQHVREMTIRSVDTKRLAAAINEKGLKVSIDAFKIKEKGPEYVEVRER